MSELPGVQPGNLIFKAPPGSSPTCKTIRPNDFSGLLWVLNDIMFVRFPAQVLAQVIKSPKAMINKSNSNYGRVTRRDSKSD